jgi:hypothetical protein
MTISHVTVKSPYTVTCTTCSDTDLQSLTFLPFKTWSKEDISRAARGFERHKGLDYFKNVPLLRLTVCVAVQRERISILPIIYVPTPVSNPEIRSLCHRRMTRSCSGHARSRMVWVGSLEYRHDGSNHGIFRTQS